MCLIVLTEAKKLVHYYAEIVQIYARCVPDLKQGVLNSAVIYTHCVQNFVKNVQMNAANMPQSMLVAKIVKKRAESALKFAKNTLL